MYPRIPCELHADPLGSKEHTLGTIGLELSGNDFEICSLMRTSLETARPGILTAFLYKTKYFT